MSRFALWVEYNGHRFAGWQQQVGLRTVQGCLQDAVSRVADEAIAVVCAGRTDRGVHATGQVVHFDSSAIRPLRGWLLGINNYLERDIVVHAVQPVDEHFHARFSAVQRRYRYIILNQATRSAVHHGLVTWYHQPLNEARMHQAAQALVGTHDFNAFRAAECQAKSSVRTISDLRVWREGHQVLMEVQANAFLHHMVRNIVGVLLRIGTGSHPIEWIEAVLASKDRRHAGVTAPPDGLYLTKIFYPQEVFA